MNRFAFLIVILATCAQIIPCGTGFCADSTSTIVVGNKVNLRTAPSMKSEILSQCNFGDKVEVLKVPENELKMGDQKVFFAKVRLNGHTGYINRLYISDNYCYNPQKKYYCFSVIINLDGVTNLTSIGVYYPETMKVDSKNFDITSVTFIDSGRYAFLDAGSDILRYHEFIELPSLESIRKLNVIDIGKVEGNKVIFKETEKSGKDHFRCFETVFKDGQFTRTGKVTIAKEQ